MRLFLFFFAGLTAASAAVFTACSSEPESSVAADAGADAAPDARRPPQDAGLGRDADAPLSTCELTKAFAISCSAAGDLNCGLDEYDAWCALNDQAINSQQFRAAEAKCLIKANCDTTRRADCEYESLAAGTLTSAQSQLVQAYCQMCEPSDVGGCGARSTSYDALAGPKSVKDIFIAAWEFNDGITNEMRTACTGAALDAGADAGDGGCEKTFAGCTADVYLSHVPDCPP